MYGSLLVQFASTVKFKHIRERNRQSQYGCDAPVSQGKPLEANQCCTMSALYTLQPAEPYGGDFKLLASIPTPR